MNRDGLNGQESTGQLPRHGRQATPRLYGLRDAATYLGISYWTIRDLIDRQALPAVRIGRRVMLDVADLNRFIEANKSQCELLGPSNLRAYAHPNRSE